MLPVSVQCLPKPRLISLAAPEHEQKPPPAQPNTLAFQFGVFRVVLTSFSLVEPRLEVADLRLLAEHLAAVGVHAGLELAHVPESVRANDKSDLALDLYNLTSQLSLHLQF